MRNRIHYYNLATTLLLITLIIASIILIKLYSQQLSLLKIDERVVNQAHFIDTLQNKVFTFYHQKEKKFKDEIMQMGLDYKKSHKEYDSFSIFGIDFDVDTNLLDSHSLLLLKNLQNQMHKLMKTSIAIIVHYTTLGLDHNSGKYGALREKAHDLERAFIKDKHKGLQIILLTLRRHEKDFMLRRLNKYIIKFNTRHQQLTHYLNRNHYKKSTVQSTLLYKKYFDEFASLYIRIGLGEKIGLTQQFYTNVTTFQSMRTQLQESLKVARLKNQNYLNSATTVVIIIFILILLIYIFYKNEIRSAQERNPLSGLNGNTRIQEHLKTIGLIEDSRAIIYFDFDYFKPFNDTFGFNIGDEAIKHFSLLLKKYFNKPRYFIGHIGGDDFVVIIKRIDYDELLTIIHTIQNAFANFAKEYYTKEQIDNKHIIIKDRFGVKRPLPLLTVSTAILLLRSQCKYFSNSIVTSILAELKSTAKLSQLAISSKLN